MSNNHFITTDDNSYNLKFLEKIDNDKQKLLLQRNLQIKDNHIFPIEPNRPGFSVVEIHNKLNDTIDDYGVAVYHPSIDNYGAILSYPDDIDQEDSLHISNKTSRMEVGDYFFCMCMFLPYTMRRTVNRVTWEVDNPQVAEIVEHNVLLCKATGTATVTVRSKANPQLTDSFTFEVVEAPTMEYPTKVNVDLVSLGITSGEVSDEVAKTNWTKMKEWLESYKDDVPREIIFPENTLIQVLLSYGQDGHQNFENIYLPSYCDINLNGSTIKVKKNNLLSYTLFRFGDTVSSAASSQPKEKPNGIECKWTRMRDGTITGEYGEKGSNSEIGYHEACLAFMYDYSERCGIQNMTVEKFPGFTIVSMKGLHSRPITLDPKSFVNGDLNPENGEQVYSNSCVVSNDFIDISFYKLRNQFDISSPYGYGGYLTGTRNYTVCFYDESKSFISSLVAARMCVNQEIPKNAKYVKFVFYCKSMPASVGNAMYIKDRYEPYRDYIIGCTLRGNKSCAFAPAGGSHFRILNNTFIDNGKQTPACDVDYEDGWQLQGYNDVWKGNTMHKHIILCAGKGFIFVENTFINKGHFWIYGGTDSCAIIKNIMKNNPSRSQFNCGVLGVFSGNDCENMSITCEGKYRTDPFVIENNKKGLNTNITADKPIEDDITFSDRSTIKNCYYRNCTITCDLLNIEGQCTFENVTFKMKYDSEIQLSYESVMILFKDCKFECRMDTVPEGQIPYCRFYGIGGASCYYKNCTFNHNYHIRDGYGWQKVNMIYDNCEFKGSEKPLRTIESFGGHFLFKNCIFNQHRFKMSENRIDGGLIEFVNCRYIEKPGVPNFFIPEGNCTATKPTFVKLANSPTLMENYEIAMGNRIVLFENDSTIEPVHPIEGFEISNMNIYKGKNSYVIKPTYIPENCTQKDFILESSKPDVVEVRGKQLYGKTLGDSVITIKSVDNELITKTFTVNVIDNDKVGDHTNLNLVTELDSSTIDQANNLWKDKLKHNDFRLTGFTYDGENDGVVNGGVKFTRGRFSQSVNGIKLTNEPFTLECIFEISDMTKAMTQFILSSEKKQGMCLGIKKNKEFGFSFISNAENFISNVVPEVGKKYHMCVTVQPKLVNYYIDGVLLYTSNDSRRANDNTALFVGGIDTISESLEGIVYKFRFYDRALTHDEVVRNYTGVDPNVGV